MAIYNNPYIGEAMGNIAKMFAPPTTAEAAAAANLKLKRDQDARKAAAINALPVEDRPWAGADVTNPVESRARSEALRRYRDNPNLTPADFDVTSYILGGDAMKTFAGQQGKPLAAGEMRVQPPAIAGTLGVPGTQFGVIQTNKDGTTTVPGPGGRLTAPEAPSGTGNPVIDYFAGTMADDGTPTPPRRPDSFDEPSPVVEWFRRGQGAQTPQNRPEPVNAPSPVVEYFTRGGGQPTGQFTIQGPSSGDTEYGLNPVYGTGPDGKPAIIQLGKSGRPVQTPLPEGFTIARDPIRVEGPTGTTLIDPQSRQVIGVIPKDVAGAARAKEVGEAEGTAVVNLPNAVATAEQTLETINQIRNHPGRNDWGAQGATAALPFIGSGIPGTAGRGFVTLVDQLKGRAFLEAFNTLKGGGAITETEGAKATAALARLDRSQSREDFDAALGDFEAAVRAGVERARAKARGSGAGTAQAPAGSPSFAAPQATSSAQSANPSGPIRVTTPEEADGLAPGTPFRTPDGRILVR